MFKSLLINYCILGATGAGKSKLSIELATCFDGKIVNSNKGLDVLSNKITPPEQRGVPHHLLGIVKNRDADFTHDDFYNHAMATIVRIIECGRVPLVVGGSNFFIRRTIGVQDMKIYLKAEIDVNGTYNENEKQCLLRAEIDEIQENTRNLTFCQAGKIMRMKDELGWDIKRIEATSVFLKSGEEAEKEWK